MGDIGPWDEPLAHACQWDGSLRPSAKISGQITASRESLRTGRDGCSQSSSPCLPFVSFQYAHRGLSLEAVSVLSGTALIHSRCCLP